MPCAVRVPSADPRDATVRGGPRAATAGTIPSVARTAAAVLLATLIVTGALSVDRATGSTASVAAAAKTTLVTLRHRPTGFSARAPQGFRLRYTGGVYRITNRSLSVTVRIVRTSQGAKDYAATLRSAGDTLVKHIGNANRSRLITDRGANRKITVVVRRGHDLVVTSAVYARRRAELAAVAAGIAASVRGGTPVGGSAAARLVPLTPYRTVDGGATAWVPEEADWVIGGTQGRLEGSSPRGRFLLGTTLNVFYPGTFAPGTIPSGGIEAPFVNAADALTSVWPALNRALGIDMTDVTVRSLLADATLPTFRSSGMMLYDFKIAGRPYVGVADIATEDRLSANPTFFWQMYISMIAVPADGDPTVGAALRLVWRSWNPAGAIASRSEQARQTLGEINGIWQGVAEFRSRTADQQSRDVSCLLRTGPFVDDHARELGLPPLNDCDSTYVRKGG